MPSANRSVDIKGGVCCIQIQIGTLLQSEEQEKIMGSELRQLLLNRKDKYMRFEACINKLENDVEELNKKLSSLNAKLENGTSTLKQVKGG